MIELPSLLVVSEPLAALLEVAHGILPAIAVPGDSRVGLGELVLESAEFKAAVLGGGGGRHVHEGRDGRREDPRVHNHDDGGRNVARITSATLPGAGPSSNFDSSWFC